MAAASDDIRVLVDSFLAEEKTLAGYGDFVNTEQPDEQEWRRLLVQNGEVTDGELRVIAYPASPKREFRLLVLMSDHCVTRLDYVFDRDGAHINDFHRPMGYPSLPIRKPHIHRWDANRRIARVDKYPRKLLYAIEIDDKITNLERAFKWFCDELRISFTGEDVPAWPTRRLV